MYKRQREGRPVDTIGQYDATKQPAIVNVDEEKALAWLAKGAQPTDLSLIHIYGRGKKNLRSSNS